MSSEKPKASSPSKSAIFRAQVDGKAHEYNYIMGNPPFVGNNQMSKEQRADLEPFFPKNKTVDYVACWYKKASELIQKTNTKCAFVSTNSITQGEQVAILWEDLFNEQHIQIDFAYRTFKWDSESTEKAHVHCVIVGFSYKKNCHTDSILLTQNQDKSTNGKSLDFPNPCGNKKRIFNADGTIEEAQNINGYLLNADDVWIESRAKPIFDVPQMATGNRPADGGHLIIEADEYDEFIKKEPEAKKWIKNLTGAEEFINNKKRYCLWLVGASPAQIKGMKEVFKRVELCKEDRLQGAADRQKLADTPAVFRETKNPERYLIVPRVSSEQRKYIPLGYLDSNTIPTDSAVIIPDATLYHFGVLTSSVHMAWMRAVCGRLKSDYRYSKDIVYNNFPWCDLTPRPPLQSGEGEAKDVFSLNDKNKSLPSPARRGAGGEVKEKIEKTAQAILDARAKYPDSSLADLYDETLMPAELRKAHRENDKAVMKAYGFKSDMSEAEIVAELFKMYEEMTAKS